MKLWRLRRRLYQSARILGDFEAVERSIDKGTPAPIAKRIERRTLWRLIGEILGKISR
jgi:hypothetical protein